MSRLQAAGVRPINNVVDVTNYVLLELGQPMHAFDLEKLAGKAIRIRRAMKGERIRTLDGIDRALEAEMLVIADADKAQAVAGVMGGGLSEVSSGTKTIVLESAFFDPKSVRRTSKKLGLKTEASARFERGADVNAALKGIERAIALLEEIGAGTARGGAIDEYPAPVAPRRSSCAVRASARMLGLEIPDADVERILKGLGFEIRRTHTGWDVAAPTFRVDVCGRSTSSKRSRGITGTIACRRPSRRSARRLGRPTRGSIATGLSAGCCSRRAARRPSRFHSSTPPRPGTLPMSGRSCRSAIRSRRSSRCFARRCCLACSPRSRTTGIASAPTCVSSSSAPA